MLADIREELPMKYMMMTTGFDRIVLTDSFGYFAQISYRQQMELIDVQSVKPALRPTTLPVILVT